MPTTKGEGVVQDRFSERRQWRIVGCGAATQRREQGIDMAAVARAAARWRRSQHERRAEEPERSDGDLTFLPWCGLNLNLKSELFNYLF